MEIFEKWIDENTPNALAKKFKVTPRTIYKWKTAESFPRPKQLRAIHLESGRRVKYSDIIHHYLSRKA